MEANGAVPKAVRKKEVARVEVRAPDQAAIAISAEATRTGR